MKGYFCQYPAFDGYFDFRSSTAYLFIPSSNLFEFKLPQIAFRFCDIQTLSVHSKILSCVSKHAERKALANLMDNEVVEVLYTCIKYAQNNIDFGEVAKELGLKDATAATRLARVMKAQQKGTGGSIAAPTPPPTPKKVQKTTGTKRGRKPKEADKESTVSDDSEPDAKKPKVENKDVEVKHEADAEDAEVEAGFSDVLVDGA